MPATKRAPRLPTDDWQQVRLFVTSPEQATYELLRPLVLFGQPVRARARETGVSERTLRRKVARIAAIGMRSLFESEDPPAHDRLAAARHPQGDRRTEGGESAPQSAPDRHHLAHRFDRPVSHQTVKQVLAAEPLPLHPSRRLPRYRDMPDPV